MSRESKIVTEEVYVVELIEDGEVKERRYLPGKSIHYLESAAENWCFGIKEI